MADEIRDDPGFRDFERRVREDLIPGLKGSAVVMSLVPDGKPDIKYAVELGLSIMFDKPIIAVVSPGTRVPNKLVLVADRIVEGDITTPTGRRRLSVALRDTMRELGDAEDRG